MKHIKTVLIILSFTCLAVGQPSPIVVETGSMEPYINIGDLLIVDEHYYSTAPIQRFDIVVLKHPAGFKAVARVIGLPGESITISKNRVFINGKKLNEPFKTKPCPNEQEEIVPCANFGPFKIPEGEYFLLADNRGGSQDSRLWDGHTINRSKILGKVTKIVPKRSPPNKGVNRSAASEVLNIP